ncbi:hypothetical protein ABZS66_10120 [Dactylosporangium sp. NPDC005572]|uniref:hypothetical protein n=1 Tax=Dactylosporangium sp. NPDC005572 TaxID=3156889 RepID=UPI0033A77799
MVDRNVVRASRADAVSALFESVQGELDVVEPAAGDSSQRGRVEVTRIARFPWRYGEKTKLRVVPAAMLFQHEAQDVKLSPPAEAVHG